jgi:hypothetical protein
MSGQELMNTLVNGVLTTNAIVAHVWNLGTLNEVKNIERYP